MPDRRQGKADRRVNALTHKLDRNFGALVLAIGFLFVGGLAEYVDNKHSNDLQTKALHHECVRVQKLRDQVNVNARIEHTIIELVGAHVGRQGDATAAFNLQWLADRLRYGPPTNCREALDHPDTYQPPKLISIGQLDRRRGQP